MQLALAARRFFDYSGYMRGYSPATIDRYLRAINNLTHITGAQTTEEITRDKIRDFFYRGRTEKNWEISTFLTYRKSLLVFFNWCIKEGLAKENFIADIEKPRLEKKLPKKLTKQEALKILEIAYNYPYWNKFLRCRNRAIFAIFIFAGLRKKELLNLKYADVDSENMTIFVRQGKGAKDRIIPMCYTLADILKNYTTERLRGQKTCPHFFASLQQNLGLTASGLKRMINIISGAAGIKFTAHKLRHTFATLMLEGGCDIFSLSKMMGHSDIKTTTIYLAASADHLRGQMMKHPLNMG